MLITEGPGPITVRYIQWETSGNDIFDQNGNVAFWKKYSFCAKPFLYNVSPVRSLMLECHILFSYLSFVNFYPLCTHSFYDFLCFCLWSTDCSSQLSATLLITEATRQWNKWRIIFYTCLCAYFHVCCRLILSTFWMSTKKITVITG